MYGRMHTRPPTRTHLRSARFCWYTCRLQHGSNPLHRALEHEEVAGSTDVRGWERAQGCTVDSWELLREDESAPQPLDGMTRTAAYLFALVLPLLARVALAAKVGAAALLGVAYQR